ncbi:GPR155 family protein [Megaselia abdita]
MDALLSNSSGAGDSGGPAIAMDKFYPALVQCFGIIICGYLAGRLKIISNSETKGLNTFVGTFALPSLIFLSLVELNWEKVNWAFLLSILVSKAIVFFAVIIITLLIARPLNYGRAGLLAIFCTQSNDFAIGYPIVEALYHKIHPEYASYLYLMAPISLAILNPIGYVLLEVSKRYKQKDEDESEQPAPPICPGASNQPTNRCLSEKWIEVLKFIRAIFFNPMLSMTVLGVAGGFIFPNGLPEIIAGVLRVLGNSFSATALFLLGLKIVGQGSSFKGSGSLIPGILIIVKLLVLPLVTRQTVNIMQSGANLNETTELSTYGFLVGTFPAAPGAFVVASQYNLDVELIAKSMVACTFISAPLMFISAKMISLTNLNPEDHITELDEFSFDISVTAGIAAIWLLIYLVGTKKVRRMPHRITACLVFSQLLCCIGVILWSRLDHDNKTVISLEFFLFYVGTCGSRLWTAILAISLLFLQCRSLCFVLKMWPYMVVVAWGVPAVISGLLIALDSNVTTNVKHNPSFQYGNAQAAIAVFVLVMCFIVTVGCLVLHQRYKKKFEKYLTLTRELSNPDSEATMQTSISTTNLIRRRSSMSSSDEEMIDDGCGNGENCCSNTDNRQATVVDIEDLLAKRKKESFTPPESPNRAICSPSYACASTSRQNCQSIVQQYQEQSRNGLEPLEYAIDEDDHQTLKHTVLLIILLCSMFVGLALSVWTLIMEGLSGIYLELSFLDAFLNFGQSLIVLAVFITDTAEVLQPVVKFWRKCWYGANVLNLPNWASLSSKTKNICEQFRNHHLENCKKDIAKDKRWRIKIYRRVFFGSDFVDWLIKVGLAKDRIQASNYAKCLVDGRVLRHINNVYHFQDKNLLYTFCNRM